MHVFKAILVLAIATMAQAAPVCKYLMTIEAFLMLTEVYVVNTQGCPYCIHKTPEAVTHTQSS
jgi:hypothetical protein